MTNIQDNLHIAQQQLSTVSDSAQLDAEVLLCHVIDKSRSHLRAWPEKQLSGDQQSQFDQLLSLRELGQPIAYLVAKKEFWSREFSVSNDVLIPRPDTELLIELALEQTQNINTPQLLDLGTGSGIIGITLAAEQPNSTIIASDICEKALDIAKHNAKTHHVDNITFIQSNWFEHIPKRTFDIILSNPPYIANNDHHLKQGDVRFEPKHALIADNNGLGDIENIIQHAPHYLKMNGQIFIEHGFDQATAVQLIFKHYEFHQIKTYDDLAGNPRVTSAQWHVK